MFRYVQSLENRTLFTTTSPELTGDVKSVLHDAQVVRAALTAEHNVVLAGTRKVVGDLRTSANKKQNAALVANLRTDTVSNYAHVLGLQNKLLNPGVLVSSQLTATAKSLLLHPTNTKLQSRMMSLDNQLETLLFRAPGDVTDWSDTFVSAFGSELDDISSANPTSKVVSDVNTAKAYAQAKGTLYDGAVNNFANDAAALSGAAQTLIA